MAGPPKTTSTFYSRKSEQTAQRFKAGAAISVFNLSLFLNHRPYVLNGFVKYV